MSDSNNSQGKKDPWPGIPAPLEHRLSTKWATLEALRILRDRLVHQGAPATVSLLTAAGWMSGTIADITETYEDSVAASGVDDLDTVSATVHLRTDLWFMYAAKDDKLQPVDTAAVIHLVDVTMRVGARRVRLARVGVFAADVIAFTLTTDRIM